MRKLSPEPQELWFFQTMSVGGLWDTPAPAAQILQEEEEETRLITLAQQLPAVGTGARGAGGSSWHLVPPAASPDLGTQPFLPTKPTAAAHRNQLASLQGEFGREPIANGGVVSILALDLPVPQRLVLRRHKRGAVAGLCGGLGGY